MGIDAIVNFRSGAELGQVAGGRDRLATSGWSTSSVDRRPANVAVEWFRVGAELPERLLEALALARDRRGGRVRVRRPAASAASVRDASVCSAWAPCTSRLSNSGSLRLELGGDVARARQRRREVLERLVRRGARPSMLAASPRMKLRQARRVFGVSVSNSWSRLTREYVWFSR